MTVTWKRALLPLCLAAAFPLSAHAAPSPAMPNHVVLHLAGKYRGMMSFKHVMASAKLRYTHSDVFISLTTDGLPKPASIGKSAYVLVAADGAMADKVGVLKITGAMAGVQGQVMMTKVQDLYVYAVSNPMVKHPIGKPVLSAML